MYVADAPRPVSIQPTKPQYSPSDEVVCSSEGLPVVTYYWRDEETNSTIDGNTLIITEAMVGTGRSYTCVAHNEIKGETMEATRTIDFIVICKYTLIM